MAVATALPVAPKVVGTSHEVPAAISSGLATVGTLQVTGVLLEAVATARMEGPREGLGPEVAPTVGAIPGGTVRHDGRVGRAIPTSVVPRGDSEFGRKRPNVRNTSHSCFFTTNRSVLGFGP